MVVVAGIAGACTGSAPEPGAAPAADVGAQGVGVEGVGVEGVRVEGVRVQLGVPYAAPGGDTVRLDLARPAGLGPHPVVLLLHGGGWEGGDRSAMHDPMRRLAARGYAAASVGYRLTRAPRNVFPASLDDVRCAVRWLRTNARALGLDSAHVGVLGFSAGAHLASMLGVGATGRAAGTAAPPPDRRNGEACLGDPAASAAVQAVVSVAGPQDLRVNGPYTEEQARLVTNFLGAFPGDAPDRAALASPIAHVGPRAAPFLLVHGTQDALVPLAHARRMRDALRAAGVPATLVELRGVGHAFPALDSADRSGAGRTIFAFFDRWLGPRRAGS